MPFPAITCSGSGDPELQTTRVIPNYRQIGHSQTTDRLGTPELQKGRRNGRTESFWAFHNRLDKNVEIGYYLGKSSRLGAGIVALLLAWPNLTESSGRYYKARTATAMLGDFN